MNPNDRLLESLHLTPEFICPKCSGVRMRNASREPSTRIKHPQVRCLRCGAETIEPLAIAPFDPSYLDEPGPPKLRVFKNKKHAIARGYYAPLLADAARQIKVQTGKCSYTDLARLAGTFQIALPTVVNFLCYAGLLPHGQWERMPKEIRDKLKAIALESLPKV